MSRQRKTPVSGTGEWASHAVNIQAGCSSDCKYCYAKTQAIRFGKNTPEGWRAPVLDKDAVSRRYGQRKGTIMFPTTHDITPDNVGACSEVLRKMLAASNKVLVVSKPHLECVRRLCADLEPYKALVLFRFTIGSADDKVLKFWEPNAPDYAERVSCLVYAYKQGFQTSVSCEPMLDGNIHPVIRTTRSFVTDAIWIGKPNKLMLRAKMNGADPETLAAAEKWLAIYTDDFIWDLYRRYKDDPIIKWKDSIKQVVGLERPTVKGLDK